VTEVAAGAAEFSFPSLPSPKRENVDDPGFFTFFLLSFLLRSAARLPKSGVLFVSFFPPPFDGVDDPDGRIIPIDKASSPLSLKDSRDSSAVATSSHPTFPPLSAFVMPRVDRRRSKDGLRGRPAHFLPPPPFFFRGYRAPSTDQRLIIAQTAIAFLLPSPPLPPNRKKTV